MTDLPAKIRLLFTESGGGQSGSADCDFAIAGVVGRAFVARSRSGSASLVIPLEKVASGPARRGAGLLLSPHAALEFRTIERTWSQPAAVIECLDPQLVDAFVALVADVVIRLPDPPQPLQWSSVLLLVDEWQQLLAGRTHLSSESELGLWAELWVIDACDDPDRLAHAWRGPDAAPSDFLLDDLGVEVKASRKRHVHHVSLSQVGPAALGEMDSFVLSMWVTVDPLLGTTLSELFQRQLERVSDPRTLVRTVARLGYSPLDAHAYTTRFRLFEDPWWVPTARVPTVHNIDNGVSDVRFVVSLDEQMRSDSEVADQLWTRVLGHAPRFTR